MQRGNPRIFTSQIIISPPLPPTPNFFTKFVHTQKKYHQTVLLLLLLCGLINVMNIIKSGVSKKPAAIHSQPTVTFTDGTPYLPLCTKVRPAWPGGQWVGRKIMVIVTLCYVANYRFLYSCLWFVYTLKDKIGYIRVMFSLCLGRHKVSWWQVVYTYVINCSCACVCWRYLSFNTWVKCSKNYSCQ